MTISSAVSVEKDAANSCEMDCVLDEALGEPGCAGVGDQPYESVSGLRIEDILRAAYVGLLF